MPHHGFLRVAAGSPDLRVADTAFNADRTLDLLAKAEGLGVNLAVFPEMGLTGYTCHDLYHTLPLQRAAEAALGRVIEHSRKVYSGVAVVGLPHEQWGEAPHAFIVLKPGMSAEEIELKQFARDRLAHFKAPQGVSFLEELPKTATGKIQKYVLRGGRPAISKQ